MQKPVVGMGAAKCMSIYAVPDQVSYDVSRNIPLEEAVSISKGRER